MTTSPAPSPAPTPTPSTGSVPSRAVVVAVPDTDLVAAVTHPDGIRSLAARIEASGASVVAVGTDRFDAEHARGDRLDPTAAVLALGRVLPRHGFLVTSAPTREHPYNLARRVLSLDHVLDGRVGLVIGARDHGVPVTAERHDPAEFAEVVRGLWRTWPLDSLIGDRAAGLFADTARIRSLDHDGGPDGYRVRGPLTTPSSRQGDPVLAVWHDVPADGVGADLVLGGSECPLAPLVSGADVTDTRRASRAGTERRDRRTLRELLALPAPPPSDAVPTSIGPAA